MKKKKADMIKKVSSLGVVVLILAIFTVLGILQEKGRI